jgi:hypothetical protein
MSGLYYSTYSSNPWSNYYGSGVTNVNMLGSMSYYSYSYYYRKRERQLSSAGSCTRSQGHASSSACLTYVSYSHGSEDYLAVDSSVDSAENVLVSGEDENFFAHAVAKLTDAFWHMSPDGALPVTLVTSAVEELIFDKPRGQEPNSIVESYEVLTTVGKFLAMIGSFYGEDKLLPIFPSCDTEFEESVVRDAVQVASASGAECQPYVGGKSILQVMRNTLVAEERFKSLPVSGFLTAFLDNGGFGR